MPTNEENKRVLVLAPHTDDGEFGCGGTIAKLVERGAEIHYAAFSSCEQSVPDGFPKDILVTEMKNATQVLGTNPDNIYLYDYDVRTFSDHRQSILDDLIKLRSDILPEIIFIPSIKDIHQDHGVIAQEGIRAFKNMTIYSYELPWNNFEFSNTCFQHLEKKHIEKKIQSINQYASQSHRAYASEEFIWSMAKMRGVQIGMEYAEVFEVVRLIHQ